MLKLRKRAKKNVKVIVGIIIGLIIGASTIVYAATIFRSEDITYSNSATTKTNVKDSLDELYDLTSNYEFYKPLADQVELGDYISITPTSTSYTISKELTGYGEDQIINPSELNLWRVGHKNADGTIDIVSEYVSPEQITLSGKTGYLNYTGLLNDIASQYADSKYVQSTRHYGYYNQIEFCSYFTSEYCAGSKGWEHDNGTLGTISRNTPDNNPGKYYINERITADVVDGVPTSVGVFTNRGDEEYFYYRSWLMIKNAEVELSYSVLPVLTIKATVKISSGDGKSADTAYTLE